MQHDEHSKHWLQYSRPVRTALLFACSKQWWFESHRFRSHRSGWRAPPFDNDGSSLRNAHRPTTSHATYKGAAVKLEAWACLT
eukprot:COSAG04_NODE_30004_length_265_cov_0.626506_1_plen_82_part_10